MANKFRVIFNYIKYKNVGRFSSREDILTYQHKKIEKFMRYLKANSTYYNKLLKQNKDFLSLPIMDKVTMMENFDELVCVDISKEEAFEVAVASEKSRKFDEKLKGITIGLSSGTSDHRGIFIASQKEADIWTGTILARLLPKMKGHQEIAFFLRANSSLYENVKTRKIGFSYYDIYKPLESHYKELERTKPNILIAPPSVLIILADAVEAGKLSLDLEKLISVAEVLEESDEVRFKKVFEQKVILQVYQCTEGFLGYTCSEGTLHINEDIVMIEEEDLGEGRFIPIITDFTRLSQPIVRYRLNDVLVHRSEPCPCGCKFMALEKIEGREDDVFIFRSINSGNPEVKVFPDLIRRCILYVEGIRQYQVIQHSHERIEIRLQYNQDVMDQEKLVINSKLVNELEVLSNQLGFIRPDIIFGIYYHEIDKKLKRVIRL